MRKKPHVQVDVYLRGHGVFQELEPASVDEGKQ